PRAGASRDRAIHWAGKGRFDPRGDELVIESQGGPARAATETDCWLSGDQSVRVVGLASRKPAQIDVAANVGMTSIGSLLAQDGEKWSGQLTSLVQARADGDRWNLGLRVEFRDPEGSAGAGSLLGKGDSVVLGAKGTYAPRSDRLEIAEVGLKAPYVAIDGSGLIREVTTRTAVELQGSLSPDYRALRTLLAQKVEPNARIAGRPCGLRIEGPISSVPAIDQRGELRGEAGIQIDALDIFGMRLADVPVVVRAVDGRLRIDPIEGTLNGGALRLEPELIRDKQGSTWLQLGSSSKLSGA